MNPQRLRESLEFMTDEFLEVGGPYDSWYNRNQYAIFGSASLIMRGILDREPGDIDVHMSKLLWGRLLPRENKGWFVETPKAGDPPILSNESTPIAIHGFFDWSDENVKMDVPDLLNRWEPVGFEGLPYRCIPVQDALEHKQFALSYGTARVQKHIPDIAIISQWLADQRVHANV